MKKHILAFLVLAFASFNASALIVSVRHLSTWKYDIAITPPDVDCGQTVITSPTTRLNPWHEIRPSYTYPKATPETVCFAARLMDGRVLPPIIVNNVPACFIILDEAAVMSSAHCAN